MRTRPKPKEYDLDLAGKWFTAIVHPKARCVVCGKTRRQVTLQGHHLIPKGWIDRELRARFSNEQRNRLIWDTRNGVAVCELCHEHHTSRSAPIPRRLLPHPAWAFAGAVDALLGTSAATVRLEQEYPET